MKHTKKLLVLVVILFAASTMQAQIHNLGFMIGKSSYFGDLNNTINTKIMSNDVGFWYKYNVNPYWGVRVGYLNTNVGAADTLSNVAWRKQRNLSFSSKISELSVVGEMNLFKFVPYSTLYTFTPYIFAGVSVVGFNPTAEYAGNVYELQLLGTEGQSLSGRGATPYKLQQLAIPMGGGIRYNVGDGHSIGLELSGRLVLTDYLDDVSGYYQDYDLIFSRSGEIAANVADRSPEIGLSNNPVGRLRGNPNTRDWFGFMNITYSYTIKAGNCPQF